MEQLCLVGAGGHFGRVIFEALYQHFPQAQFLLLGRHSRPWFARNRCHFIPFDYKQAKGLPAGMPTPKLLLDLSGPCQSHDGILQRLCLRAGVGYVDIAVHNRHFEQARAISAELGGFSLVHTGLFPGVSNLMADWVLREAVPEERVVLLSTFPAVAGGGRHVAESFGDMVAESCDHFYVREGQRIPARLFQDREVFPFQGGRRRFYRWQLPELPCLVHSRQPYSLERWVSLYPSLLNPLFHLAAPMLHRPRSRRLLLRFLKPALVFAKGTLLRRVDPPCQMTCLALGVDGVRGVSLSSANAVALHGVVMVATVKGILHKPLPKGFFVPEQLLNLEQVLAFGQRSEYHLERVAEV